jgi:hypothetical protein
MQITNPKIDAGLALADAPTPFQSPVSGAPESSPLPNYDDHLNMLVKYFEESEDLTQRARELSERDRDYHDNFDDNHWTAKEKALLNKRGQPAITSNYIKRKVSTLCGGERRMRSDPKAFPRNPQDEQTATAATDALRFVGDQNKFNVVRSKVYEEMLVEGFGGADVVIEDTPRGEKKVSIKRVPWDRLFFDPHSSASDFSDATYKGIVIWKDAKRTDQDVLGETLRTEGTTYDDRPKTAWVDSKRTRVRVVQIHYLHEGEWMVATFTKAGFIEEPVVSPYVDRDGRSACSLIMRSAYVDRENNRFGAVRDWISTQEEINKRRSKMLHLLSARQTYGNRNGVTDAAKFKTEMAKPDGHAELNEAAQWGKDVGVVPTGEMAMGHAEMLHLSINEMQASGPNAAMAGKAPGQQSGRALEAQMQAGSVEMEPLVDELRQWTREVYEAAWMRIRQFWTDETWVRVTDDDRNIKFVGLNKQVTLKDKLEQMQPEEARAMAQQLGIQSPYDPALKEVIEVENEVSGLDVDIEIEEGPDISTLQSEQFETLAGLVKAGLPIPPDAIVEASSLRNKDQILKKMRGEEDDQNPALMQAKQQIEQMQQAAQELQQQLVEAQRMLKDKQGEMQIKGGELQIKARELSIKEREQKLAEFQALNAPQPVEQAAAAPAAPAAAPQPQQITVTTPESQAAVQGVADVAQTFASALQQQGEQTAQALAEQTAAISLLAQAMAPKPPMQIVHQRDEAGRIVASVEVVAQ